MKKAILNYVILREIYEKVGKTTNKRKHGWLGIRNQNFSKKFKKDVILNLLKKCQKEKLGGKLEKY